MLRIIAAVVIAMGLVAPAWAGFFEGWAAYERGDYAAALRELRPLAEQGDADAQSLLGYMYTHGLGVPPDYREAVRWLRKAAEQGHAQAQANLGSMYATGRGVPQDYLQAHKWYDLAAATSPSGEARKQAANKRDFTEGQMTSTQLAEAQRLVREWMEEHQALE